MKTPGRDRRTRDTLIGRYPQQCDNDMPTLIRLSVGKRDRRRRLVMAGLLAATLPLAAAGRQASPSPSPSPLTLWYRQPAAQWVEALPVGNGRLSAMVFGGLAEERLQLNEDTLWSGGPYDPANPDARAALPKVR